MSAPAVDTAVLPERSRVDAALALSRYFDEHVKMEVVHQRVRRVDTGLSVEQFQVLYAQLYTQHLEQQERLSQAKEELDSFSPSVLPKDALPVLDRFEALSTKYKLQK
jgi:hypothetical protein